MSKQIKHAKLEVAESVLRGMIADIGPEVFATALNNACVHGEVFEDGYSEFLDEKDDFIFDWYKGIESLDRAVRRHKLNYYELRNDLEGELKEVLLKKYETAEKANHYFCLVLIHIEGIENDNYKSSQEERILKYIKLSIKKYSK